MPDPTTPTPDPSDALFADRHLEPPDAEPDAERTPPDPTALQPVTEPERIVSLDVLRGFAIFGIFWVNIVFFARPFIDVLRPIGGDDAGTAEVIAWAVVKTLFEYKFISLFSLLFGAGLAVQLRRAQAAGRPFAWLYLRRLVVLAAFGLFHALGLWYGDILFMYAGWGLILLLCARLSARVLLTAAIIVFISTAAIAAGLGALQVAFGQMSQAAPAAVVEMTGADPPAAAPAEANDEGAADPSGADDANDADDDAVTPSESEPEPEPDAAPSLSNLPAAEALAENPFRAAGEALMSDGGMGMFGDRWQELERVAYGEGPFASAFAMRSIIYAFILVNMVFSFGWRILAMFLAGAALMKLGFFEAGRARWHRWCFLLGVGIGLPGELVATGLDHWAEFGSWPWLGAAVLHNFASMVLCLGYVGLVLVLVRDGRSLLARGFAAVGRMALSNYLLQTLTATFVMYWWGLGLFGTWERPRLLVFAVAVYVGQMLLSVAWLRVFRMGPAEWLWRTLTYLRPQPLLRRSSGQ